MKMEEEILSFVGVAGFISAITTVVMVLKNQKHTQYIKNGEKNGLKMVCRGEAGTENLMIGIQSLSYAILE